MAEIFMKYEEWLKEWLDNYTEKKLVYQEQFIEIINKVCGYDLSKSDFIRREIAKAKKESLEEVQKILLDKFGEKGARFFEYLYETGRYTVSKAYIVANLYNLIEY